MKVLVVDDHPVFREGLAALLGQLGDATVVLQAAGAASALELIALHSDIDIVVLDLLMPGMGGLSAIAAFGQARPDLPVIILSSSEEPQDAKRAFAQGALGYVPKSASQHVLLAAIRIVLDGDRYVPPLILDSFAASRQPISARSAEHGLRFLTDRQLDVLRRLAEGGTNKMIANDLDLSEKTVKAHVTAIFRALDVITRTQAANVGRQTGLI